MASLCDIRRKIASLSPDDLAELRAWFERFDAEAWDKEFEENARSGKLDAVAEKAIDACRAKRPAIEARPPVQVKSQERLRRLKGKVRWEGNLEEMRRD